MSLKTVSKAYSETFSSSSSWTVQHNLGVDSPVVDVYNGSDTRVLPQSVIVDSANQLTINWSVATAGRVYVV